MYLCCKTVDNCPFYRILNILYDSAGSNAAIYCDTGEKIDNEFQIPSIPSGQEANFNRSHSGNRFNKRNTLSLAHNYEANCHDNCCITEANEYDAHDSDNEDHEGNPLVHKHSVTYKNGYCVMETDECDVHDSDIEGHTIMPQLEFDYSSDKCAAINNDSRCINTEEDATSDQSYDSDRDESGEYDKSLSKNPGVLEPGGVSEYCECGLVMSHEEGKVWCNACDTSQAVPEFPSCRRSNCCLFTTSIQAGS